MVEADGVGDAPILICYDGSDEARRAIDVAAELLVERRAVVLYVGPLLMDVEAYAAVGPGATELDNVVLEDALTLAEAGAERARKAGFHAGARADIDAPTWHGVVEVADDIGAAAIVLGSRGLSGVHELLEGSLSHQVAEQAGRPVLIVPPPRR
jgi:nucleotide-binding universal stress UspA family protein